MPALMNTESRRKASAAYHAKREAEGLKKVTLWLSPEARFKLDALKAAAGSKDKAAEAAILAWSGADAAPAPQLSPTRRSGLAVAMLRAWNNIPEGKEPPEWFNHPSDQNRVAWERVAQAARDYLDGSDAALQEPA